MTLCPSLNAPPGFFFYTSPTGQPLTGGYGYNKAIGGRKMVTIPSTNTTYLFCDSALLVCDPCTMQETDAIVGPVPLTHERPVRPLPGVDPFPPHGQPAKWPSSTATSKP